MLSRIASSPLRTPALKLSTPISLHSTLTASFYLNSRGSGYGPHRLPTSDSQGQQSVCWPFVPTECTGPGILLEQAAWVGEVKQPSLC